MYECKPFISSCYGFVGQKAHKSWHSKGCSSG
jgi:hypothetical protein